MEKVNIPKNRQQAIDLANKIKELRKERFKNKEINIPVLLRLQDLPPYERENAMERLVQEGYAGNVKEIERMLKSKEVVLSPTGGSVPTESVGMSDDKLDAGIQYLHINLDLF